MSDKIVVKTYNNIASYPGLSHDFQRTRDNNWYVSGFDATTVGVVGREYG